jgi:hypothetical protein
MLVGFQISTRDLKELIAPPRLGAPSFMRIDEKRWCQAIV